MRSSLNISNVLALKGWLCSILCLLQDTGNPRRCLEGVRSNFLTQILDRLRDDVQMDLLFIDREELTKDRINTGVICYTGSEIAELKILR